jgi:hypothetical protein
LKREEFDAFFRRTLSSDLLADAVVLFRNNPGLVDTEEAVARRLGVSRAKFAVEARAMKKVGIIREEKVGGATILSYDRAADEAVSAYVGEALARKRVPDAGRRKPR